MEQRHGSSGCSIRGSVAGAEGEGGSLVPGCGRVCGCQGHRLGKSANNSLEALELVLHPTAAFSALDENVAVCPVQVHDELWCILTVHWHSLAQGWQTHGDLSL